MHHFKLNQNCMLLNLCSLEYDYQHTNDGFDFTAWSLEDEERVAKIKLWTFSFLSKQKQEQRSFKNDETQTNFLLHPALP